MEIPAISLKAIVLVHWLLTVWYELEHKEKRMLMARFQVIICEFKYRNEHHTVDVIPRGCLITWLPYSFILGNLSVLALGVWAIAQRDSIDAVVMFLMGLAVTILTDIVHIGVYYTQSESLYERTARDTFRFSAGMAILSLLLKPVSCFFVYQMYRERGGDYNVNFDLETSVDSRCTTDSADSTFFTRRY